MVTFFAYYQIERPLKKTVYEELTEKNKANSAKFVAGELQTFANALCDVLDSDSKAVSSLRYLRDQVFWKTILASAAASGFEDLPALAGELRSLFYSYWIAGYTSTKLRGLAFDLVHRLKEHATIDQIRAAIRARMEDDDVVKWMRDNLSGNAYETAWAKPLLLVLEYDLVDDAKPPFMEMGRNLNIDHVLPVEWGSFAEWKAVWERRGSCWPGCFSFRKAASNYPGRLASDRQFLGPATG